MTKPQAKYFVRPPSFHESGRWTDAMCPQMMFNGICANGIHCIYTHDGISMAFMQAPLSRQGSWNAFGEYVLGGSVAMNQCLNHAEHQAPLAPQKPSRMSKPQTRPTSSTFSNLLQSGSSSKKGGYFTGRVGPTDLWRFF